MMNQMCYIVMAVRLIVWLVWVMVAISLDPLGLVMIEVQGLSGNSVVCLVPVRMSCHL